MKIWNKDKAAVTTTEVCDIVVYIILGINTLTEKITVGDFSSLVQAILKFTEALNGYFKRLVGIKIYGISFEILY